MIHTEEAFESVIETALLSGGYVREEKSGYDRTRGCSRKPCLPLSAKRSRKNGTNCKPFSARKPASRFCPTS